MRLAKAVFCVCALVVFGALSFNMATSSTNAAAQAKVDYTKKPWPDSAPGATYTDLPKPIMLGEPGNGPWGNDDKWGVSKFTHEDHYSKYKVDCHTCHHTNGAGDAAKTEEVKRCVACHKESGNEKNPVNEESGDEIDVKLGFHGSPDNTTNQAGCITCHKQRKVEPTGCAGCHAAK